MEKKASTTENMDYGFVKVASAIPSVRVADCSYNTAQIIELITEAESQNASIICFPELCMTGYTCGDLFSHSILIENAEKQLGVLLDATAKKEIISIIGMPIMCNGSLLNAAVVIQHGKILGIVPKTYLPNYKEFYEKRWFASSLQIKETSVKLAGQICPLGTDLIFRTPQTSFAIEICEDLWAPIPPSSLHALNGAEIIFNLSADNECVGKHDYLCGLIENQSARCICGYVFSSCGFGESTTDLVFAGNAIIAESGKTIGKSKRFSFDSQLTVNYIDVESIRNDRRVNTTFSESKASFASDSIRRIETISKNCAFDSNDLSRYRKFNQLPFVPQGKELERRCEEIISIQTAGLAKRLKHTNAKSAVIGISGGLDSTLALLASAMTFDKLKLDRKGIVGVTMPGFGTTDRTHNNATKLMEALGITMREISIKDACLQHFKDISHNPDCHDVVYENSQARERTQILMDIANQTGGLVIGTGDLSELALGWATYNGDHMSMYGINASIPKTLIKHLVRWIALNSSDDSVKTTLLDIIDTPISPELIPADENGNIKQKTEDLVGPYELHDFFLYHFLRNGFSPAKINMLAICAFGETYDKATIKHWLTTFCHRFFNQQFKRSCLPDGPKVGLSLSPRGDWRMPSDAASALWMEECNNL